MDQLHQSPHSEVATQAARALFARDGNIVSYNTAVANIESELGKLRDELGITDVFYEKRKKVGTGSPETIFTLPGLGYSATDRVNPNDPQQIAANFYSARSLLDSIANPRTPGGVLDGTSTRYIGTITVRPDLMVEYTFNSKVAPEGHLVSDLDTRSIYAAVPNNIPIMIEHLRKTLLSASKDSEPITPSRFAHSTYQIKLKT